VEVLSYAHGPNGRHPASWGYRPGEHYRWVLLPGIDVEVMLVTSWMAVNAVLCSGASPGIRFPLIGHNERYPDFNTLPSGGLHARIRNIIGPIIGKRNAQRAEMLRDTARQLVTKLDLTSGPADLREGYSVPMTQALAASLGFPESEYRDAVIRPTAVEQRLVGDTEDLKEVSQALKELLEYCRDLDRKLRKRPDADGIPLARIAAIMRAQGLPDEVIWHTFRTLATGSVTPAGGVLDRFLERLVRTPDLARTFYDSPQLRPGIISEIVRDDSYFGLMNYREITEPLVLPDRTVIPVGPAVLSMDAALHDPARFPEPDQFNIYRPVDTTPWGIGEFGCPAFRSSWELLVIVGEEFSGRYGAYPWRPYIAREPVFFDALLPGMTELLVGCRIEMSEEVYCSPGTTLALPR
jgi:cytochrome P450